MYNAEYWIEKLNLAPHPEGGFYRQTDQSKEIYNKNGKEFSLYTNIYFLLTTESPSHFHQLSSDELWFYHGGNSLTIHTITENGDYRAIQLGLGENEHLQYTVSAGTIFGSTVEEGFSLVSCAVIPGFDFSDFKLFSQQELLERFPNYKELIKRLACEKV